MVRALATCIVLALQTPESHPAVGARATREAWLRGTRFQISGPQAYRSSSGDGVPSSSPSLHWYHHRVSSRDPHWDLKRCVPLPGVQPELLTADGKVIKENEVEGLLCIKFPWPSMLRTTYGDHERCRQTYFSTFSDYYFTGDGAKRDKDGLYRIIGRVDDVINVSGHRLGTAEIESAINEHDNVVESAVVGYPHDIKGQGIYAYVITNHPVADEAAFIKEVLGVVTREMGPIAKPDRIQIVPGLPKTRSGKIMRRILRKIAAGDVGNLGDVSTLLNPEVVDSIKEGAVAEAK